MPTPDDPRMANLFVLLFASVMGALFWLGLSRHLAPAARTPRRDLLLLLGWGYVWVLVLLVNAAVASSAGRSWARIAALPAVDSLAAVQTAANGSQVLLVGHARPAPGASADAAPAYVIEYELDGARALGESGELGVALAGGVQQVTRLATAFPWNWHYQRGHRARRTLSAGEPVVVLGTVGHGVSLASAERGKRLIWVEAGLVFRGSRAAFVAAAEEEARRLWPRILAWGSVAAAIVVALLPLAGWVRRLVR